MTTGRINQVDSSPLRPPLEERSAFPQQGLAKQVAQKKRELICKHHQRGKDHSPSPFKTEGNFANFLPVAFLL